MSEKKTYTCDIKIVFSGNNDEAWDKDHYITQVKEKFYDDYGINLEDSEIKNIQIRKD
tara:strand:- start:59 stop:232 length:174 start_codon:yes stop_codon:yes gene_type:complete